MSFPQIEELGGYEKALSYYQYSTSRMMIGMPSLAKELLAYRIAHNIIDNGDMVVYINHNLPDTLIRFQKWRLSHSPELFRHATTLEIIDGKRRTGMLNHSFKIGDIVYLNSGSPSLNVTQVTNDNITVTWMVESNMQVQDFPYQCLSYTNNPNWQDDIEIDKKTFIANVNKLISYGYDGNFHGYPEIIDAKYLKNPSEDSTGILVVDDLVLDLENPFIDFCAVVYNGDDRKCLFDYFYENDHIDLFLKTNRDELKEYIAKDPANYKNIINEIYGIWHSDWINDID